MPVSDQWASLLAALRSPVQGTGGQEQLLILALGLSRDVAAGIVGASLTEIAGGAYRTPVASSPLALELDRAQYAASTGPCVSAVRDRQLQRINVIDSDERWPAFAAAAVHHGVSSSMPYPVAGTAQPTALNIYSTADSAFASARSIAVAGLLAHCVSTLSPVGIDNAKDAADDADTTTARHRGARVNEAVEQIMRRQDLSRSDAFAELAHRGQAEHISIAVSAKRELTVDGCKS